MPKIVELESWRTAIRQWAMAWGCDGLDQRVSTAVSKRLVTTLGRYEHKNRQITLAAFLLDGPDDLLNEVLCHEAAHAAVAELHGRSVRPHGEEWRALMRSAGFCPRARIKRREIERAIPGHTRQRSLWEHRCPICQARRMARRSVPQWRCVRCRANGLDGRLVITKVEGHSLAPETANYRT